MPPEQQAIPCKITLTMKRPITSLNIILKMSPWERSAEKKEVQFSLLEAIQEALEESKLKSHATSPDQSIRATSTSLQNTLSMAFATLRSYVGMDHKTSTSTFDRSKFKRDAKRKLLSRLHQSKHHEK